MIGGGTGDIRADGDAHLAMTDFNEFVVPACESRGGRGVCGGVLMPTVTLKPYNPNARATPEQCRRSLLNLKKNFYVVARPTRPLMSLLTTLTTLVKVIFFGGSLDAAVKAEAARIVEGADRLLVLGTTVQVCLLSSCSRGNRSTNHQKHQPPVAPYHTN